MSKPAEDSRVLVLHRRELGDVCRVLDELGIAYDERSTAPSSAKDGGPWRLVVATPQRILELRSASGVTDAAPHIAVCDGFSRTLQRKLGQARVDFVLRRPVHPGALRLLLLHAWYAGPEKRRFRRVSIGAPIRVRLGWRTRPGMLLELSSTGCRIQTDRLARADSRLQVWLPTELTGQRAVRLKGRVVRSTAAAGSTSDATKHELAVQFDSLTATSLAVVTKLLRDHDQGPAAWKGALPVPQPNPDRTSDRAEPGAAEGATPAREADTDRRQSPRLRYAKPVLVKGDGASRILMGKDLSIGGMRVMRDASLSVGDELKLALYGEDGVPPLMLTARVAREDGAHLVLHFADLEPEGREQIERFMSVAPVSGAEDGDETALIVSEIVEQCEVEAAADEKQDAVGSESDEAARS